MICPAAANQARALTGPVSGQFAAQTPADQGQAKPFMAAQFAVMMASLKAPVSVALGW